MTDQADTMLTVAVRIPPVLRRHCDGQTWVRVEAGAGDGSVGGAIGAVIARHPDLRPHMLNDGGQVHSFINVFLGETNIRELDGFATAAGPGAEITVLPGVAGG